MKIITESGTHTGYKIKIHPNKEQETIFNKYFGTARYIYNLGIDIQNKNKEETGKYLGFYSLDREITKLKHTEKYSWLNEFDSAFIKSVILDLSNAYKYHKNNPKYYKRPRYKSKKKSKKQFPIRSDTMSIRDGQMFIPSIGLVDIYNSYGDKIKGYGCKKIINGNYIKFCNPRISFNGSNYYLSFTIAKDEDHNINSYESYYGNQQWQEQESSKAIGIDVGLRHDKWLKDSTGRTVKRPKCEKENERLKFYQRKLDRQYETNKAREPRTFKNRKAPKNGISKNMQKTKIKINKIYDKIVNKRRNIVYSYCNDLLSLKPEAIVMEDIGVQTLVVTDDTMICKEQKEMINDLIYNAALFDTMKIIENTMVNNGIKVIYADRNYPSSQLCSNCGHRHNIGQAKYYRCPECGMVMDRDFNAAINLSKLAYLKCPVERLEVE